MISGCASFGKGVAEAFLESRNQEDLRACEVYGRSFQGIAPDLKQSEGTNKLLMVHGVSHHLPGYSTEFMSKLARELDLNIRNRNFKEISLTDPFDQAKNLGNLRVHRLTNEQGTKELLFYELTWSEITAEEKSLLDFDSSGEYSYRRADVNNALKIFSNDTAPDPLIYMGNLHDDILTSFRQSFCWMISADWNDIPGKTNEFCNPLTEQTIKNLSMDRYSVVSHSLGSRIAMDAIQSFIGIFEDDTKSFGRPKLKTEILETFRSQKIPIYMLSNQLPMLQMGSNPPVVVGQRDDYCLPDGKHYNERMLTKTSILAFSDPNDLLSFAIPRGFAQKKLDSRFCIDVTNISINIANVMSLFQLGTMANPLTAHTDYDSDDRVVALIANGIGNDNTSPLVKERCEWIKLID